MMDLVNKLNNIKAHDYSSIELSYEERKLLEESCPENVLITYGTLAPGKHNHNKVADIKGIWKIAKVRGILENKGWGAEMGFYGFIPASDGEEIYVQVLTSENLPDYWSMLDSFEGEEYRRILIDYILPDGHVGLGYIYALNHV